MVLQNKYKAKASRRYNASKGSSENGESGSSKPGYRNGQVRKHGSSSRSQLNDADDHEGEGTSNDEEEGGDDDEEQETDEGDANFPSLAKASSTTATTSTELEAQQSKEEDPSNPTHGKYARRRLGESKLARLERLEASKDPRLAAAEDEEPEPEVDLTNLIAKVAALGDSNTTQAGLAEEIARQRGQGETASDIENDIDHSLSHLHEKERERQRAKGRGGAADDIKKPTIEVTGPASADVDAAGNKIDYEQMKKEKEKAEAVRALKARFQGRDLGERERRDVRSRTAPSLNIGPKKADSITSSDSSGSDNVPVSPDPAATGNVSQSLAAEIESSLAKTRRKAKKDGETSSVNSGKSSSFSIKFSTHRRRSPFSPRSEWDPERGSGVSSGTERIDNFLASINDRSLDGKGAGMGKDSLFMPHHIYSRPRTSSNARFDHSPVATPPLHSKPGELHRLESFLDDMLG